MKSEVIKNFNEIRLDSKIRGILLDFDNCLYIYKPCHQKAIQKVQYYLDRKNIHMDDFINSYEKAKKMVKKHIPHHAASHSRLLYFKNIFENTEGNSMVRLSLDLDMLYWKEFMKNMVLIDGVKIFLENCKKNNIKIAIVSDLTANIQFKKLIKLKIDHLIDFVITSEEVGAEKPNEKIFKLALDKLKLKNSDVVMLGDDENRDIYGASKLGIKTIKIVHEK